MKANYEIKLEGKERVYQIVFTPNAKYGNYSCKVYNRLDAYAKYRELKALFIDKIPGRLTVYECIRDIDGTYKKGYLCSIRTGKENDSELLFNEIDTIVRKLNKLYNKQQVEEEFNRVSDHQFDLIHCIEILNFHLQDEETDMYKKIVNEQQLSSLIRRHYKNTLKDYNDIREDYNKFKTDLRRIQSKLKDNQAYRKNSSIVAKGTKKSGAQIKLESYLASLGLSLEDNERDELI